VVAVATSTSPLPANTLPSCESFLPNTLSPTVLTFELWLKPISELPQYNFRTARPKRCERPKPADVSFPAAGSRRRQVS
jgi:hypothetical protein